MSVTGWASLSFHMFQDFSIWSFHVISPARRPQDSPISDAVAQGSKSECPKSISRNCKIFNDLVSEVPR